VCMALTAAWLAVVSKRQSTKPLCARALRQRGGSPSIRCRVVRVSRACRAFRAALASLAVMGSRVDDGRSSQVKYLDSSSSFSSGVLTIGTFSRAACVALRTFPQLWLTKPCASAALACGAKQFEGRHHDITPFPTTLASRADTGWLQGDRRIWPSPRLLGRVLIKWHQLNHCGERPLYPR